MKPALLLLEGEYGALRVAKESSGAPLTANYILKISQKMEEEMDPELAKFPDGRKGRCLGAPPRSHRHPRHDARSGRPALRGEREGLMNVSNLTNVLISIDFLESMPSEQALLWYQSALLF